MGIFTFKMMNNRLYLMDTRRLICFESNNNYIYKCTNMSIHFNQNYK